MDVLEGDVAYVAEIEAPGREFAKHRELRILLYLLWNITFAPKGYIGHRLAGATWILYVDILENDVLYPIIGNATDAAGERVMEEVI